MCGEDEDAKEDEFEYLVVVIIIMTKQLVCFCSFSVLGVAESSSPSSSLRLTWPSLAAFSS
jgi:hypothetical protein